MKIFVCSDLHIDTMTERLKRSFELPDADLYFIAGDLMNGVNEENYDWLLNKTKGIKTYFTLGNHDYFYTTREQAFLKINRLIQNTHMHLVCDEAVEIQPGINLWASDMWTNMKLAIHVKDTMDFTLDNWDDCRSIGFLEENGKLRSLSPSDMLNWHNESVAKLLEFLNNTSEKTILMTHHGLFPQCLVRNLEEEPIGLEDALMTSDYSNAILNSKNPPVIAINGHIHKYKCQQLNPRTTLVCNPRGGRDSVANCFINIDKRNGNYAISVE